MNSKKTDVKTAMRKLKFVQINDPVIIKKMLRTIMQEHPQMHEQFNQRPLRVRKFYLGQLMKATKGQAAAKIASEILEEMLQGDDRG